MPLTWECSSGNVCDRRVGGVGDGDEDKELAEAWDDDARAL